MPIKFDAAKCTGCQACQMACLDQNDIRCADGKRLCVKLPAVNMQTGFKCSFSIAYTAENVSPSVQQVVFPSWTAWCWLMLRFVSAAEPARRYAPMDVISFVPDTGKVKKCDGCIGRIRVGLLPACVHTCPTGALSWIENGGPE